MSFDFIFLLLSSEPNVMLWQYTHIHEALPEATDDRDEHLICLEYLFLW